MIKDTMNEFDLALRIEELNKLTTKKSKLDFIKMLSNSMTWHGTSDLLLLKLVNITLHKFKDEPRLSGITSLSRDFTVSIAHAIDNNSDIDFLGDALKTNVTNSGDYNAFMGSSGIPAYLKLAVLKAKYNAI